MIRAIVHQGSVGKEIEYFAVIAGPDVERRFFYEQILNPRGDVIRYFAGGSEVVLNPEGVRFQGNGGIFGEYMFGGHLPVGDLLNDEVVNRLVLFGATADQKSGEIRFTYNTTGFETYDNLFLQGNAIANYIFFIDDRKKFDDITDRQTKTLRSAGKLMKRSRKVGSGQFIGLAHEIIEALGEPESTLIMLRIVNLPNQRFAERCREAYASRINVEELVSTDAELGRVEAYQRERIGIDVIYHDPANHELINEYKRILASCAGSTINPSARARLMRIRTLSLRNEVPLSIFDTLEEILLQEPRSATEEAEPDYISSTREILGGFLLGKNIRRRLSSLDMVQLMENKQRATANRDQTFEELLLETGRQIDEIGREEADLERLESFGELVTLFDRIDHTTTMINKLAFMDDVELTQEQVRSLLGNMQVFESLRRGLFQQLFIDPIMTNDYVLSFGKKKLYAFTLGMISLENNEASIGDVTASIAAINRTERAYFAVYNVARRRMANFYLELNTAEGRDTFRREIRAEIGLDSELRELQESITEALLEEVITKIRLEAFYINQLLPRIIDEQDAKLRNDFLSNSGLDRFQIEDLEREYFEMRALPLELLSIIQQPLVPEPQEAAKTSVSS